MQNTSLTLTKKPKLHKKHHDTELIIMMIPGILFFFLFAYLPFTGVFISFTDYMGGDIFKGKWVGFRWFIYFFESPDFYRLVRNTVIINTYNIIFGFTITIFFALMLNEIGNQSYKKFVQTCSYLPYFISTVVVVGLLYNFFTPYGGIVNLLLNRLGINSINFMTSNRWFRTMLVGSNIWQTFGFSSIIYLSAISGINMELYDAANVDGCNRIQKIRYITLPAIYPTIAILLILNLGQMFNMGYEKIILMYSPQTYATGDVIGTYIYRRGIQGSEFSFTTAVGLFNSTLNVVFLLIVNKVAKHSIGISLW